MIMVCTRELSIDNHGPDYDTGLSIDIQAQAPTSLAIERRSCSGFYGRGIGDLIVRTHDYPFISAIAVSLCDFSENEKSQSTVTKNVYRIIQAQP